MLGRRPFAGAGRRNALPAGGAAAFSPLDVDNLVLWLRGDLGITLNGDNVSAWADQSGEGNDATQGTMSSQPLYVESDADFGGQATLDFISGSPSVMVIPHALELGNADDWEIQIVCSHPTSPTNVTLFTKFNTGFDWTVRKDTLDRANAALRDNDDNSSATATDTSPLLDDATQPRWINVYADVSACEVGVRVDGGSFVTATDTAPANVDTADVSIGSRAGGASSSDATIAEILFYRRILTTGERAALQAYFSARYGEAFGS
jgi:hypothetical protein